MLRNAKAVFSVSLFILASIFASNTGWADTARPFKSFKTSFDKRPRYFKPHGPDTARKAFVFRDGVAIATIKPGMSPASTDLQNGKERAEMGQLAERAKFIRQTFKLRVDTGFKAPRRLMVAQIKQGVGTNFSPAIAVYLTGTGRAKCIDYSGGVQNQKIIETRRHGINLTDGKWHSVVMDYGISNTDGYCRITIDGKIIVSMQGHDSDPNGRELAARIGPYRDNTCVTNSLF